jgi:multiple sugar transport system ATP-binding protein
MAEILFDRVTKRFGVTTAVHNLNLTVNDKELLTLVGPSGCGKSTTLSMLAGLEDPTEGLISIDDRVVNDVPPGARDIAMVFQSYALYPHMSVRQNIGFGLEVRGVKKVEIKRRVDEAAKLLDIGPYLDRRPKELSGGQRQRVALGRALTRDPKVFLLDEPLSNLDAQLRTQMRAELRLLFRRIEGTVVYVTHDQAEAMTLSDRLVVMRDGVVQQAGTPLDVYNRPVNVFVARFLGSPSMNFVTGVLQSNGAGPALATSPVAFPLPESKVTPTGLAGGEHLILGVRPEDLTVSLNENGGVPCQVEVIEPMGSANVVYVNTGADRLVGIMPPDFQAEMGDRAWLNYAPSQLHLFNAESELAYY